MVYLLKMVIFHGYVKEPEGKYINTLATTYKLVQDFATIHSTMIISHSYTISPGVPDVFQPCPQVF